MDDPNYEPTDAEIAAWEAKQEAAAQKQEQQPYVTLADAYGYAVEAFGGDSAIAQKIGVISDFTDRFGRDVMPDVRAVISAEFERHAQGMAIPEWDAANPDLMQGPGAAFLKFFRSSTPESLRATMESLPVQDTGSALFSSPAPTSQGRGSIVEMPPAVIGHSLDATKHPEYAAAKAGNPNAALRVARDLVTPQMRSAVKALIGDSTPVIVPVVAIEATGNNMIPQMVAIRLEESLGLSSTAEIVQSVRAHRSDKSGLDRVFSQPEFSGPVEQGQTYLLVDDTLTQGGTFAALADYITRNGGEVVGAVALTGKQYSATLRLSEPLLAQLRKRLGDLEDTFRTATGHGFERLTESEARTLVSYGPLERVRARIVEAAVTRGDGLGTLNEGQGDSSLGSSLRSSPSQPGFSFDQTTDAGDKRQQGLDFTASQATPASPGRFRPKTLVEFAKPYRGPSGAELQAYEWKHTLQETVDKRGEDSAVRVSNWEDAATNMQTGREIVHQFHVTTKDGKAYVVSLESALKILGYTSENGKAAGPVRNLASMLRTRAQLAMEAEALRPAVEANEAKTRRYEQEQTALQKQRMPKPVFTVEEGRPIMRIGALEKWGTLAGTPESFAKRSEYDLRTLEEEWRREQARAVAGLNGGEYNTGSKLREIEARIARMDRKIQDAAAAGSSNQVDPASADTTPLGLFDTLPAGPNTKFIENTAKAYEAAPEGSKAREEIAKVSAKREGMTTHGKVQNVPQGMMDFGMSGSMGTKDQPSLFDTGPNGRPSIQTTDGGTLEAPGQISLFSSPAYHGTPHKVDKFSLDKIGTGEGVQAYGWGLYFADSKEVGEGYRQRLSGGQWQGSDGTVYQPLEIREAVEKKAKELGFGIRAATDAADNWSSHAKGQDMSHLAAFEAIRQVVVEKGIKVQQTGNLYRVELDVDDADLLDWDKPLSEQSEKVRAALSSVGKLTAELASPSQRQYHDGSTAYGAAQTDFGSPEKASAALYAAGIPGIRFLDGNSRVTDAQIDLSERTVAARRAEMEADPTPEKKMLLGMAERYLEGLRAKATQGTYNYVIFDESKIKITEENGKPVKPAGQLVSMFPQEPRSTPHTGFEEKLQAKIDEIKRNASSLFSSPSNQRSLDFGFSGSMGSRDQGGFDFDAKPATGSAKMPRRLPDTAFTRTIDRMGPDRGELRKFDKEAYEAKYDRIGKEEQAKDAANDAEIDAWLATIPENKPISFEVGNPAEDFSGFNVVTKNASDPARPWRATWWRRYPRPEWTDAQEEEYEALFKKTRTGMVGVSDEEYRAVYARLNELADIQRLPGKTRMLPTGHQEFKTRREALDDAVSMTEGQPEPLIGALFSSPSIGGQGSFDFGTSGSFDTKKQRGFDFSEKPTGKDSLQVQPTDKESLTVQPAAEKSAIQWMFALRTGEFESANEWARAVPPGMAREIVDIAAEELQILDSQLEPNTGAKASPRQIDLLNQRRPYQSVIIALTYEHGEAIYAERQAEAQAATAQAESEAPSDVPSFFTQNANNWSLWDMDERVKQAQGFAELGETISETPNERGTAFTPEAAMYQLINYEDFVSSTNGMLISRNRTNASPNALADAWVSMKRMQNLIANSRAENPDMWAAYDARQAALQQAKEGDMLRYPHSSSDNPLGGPVKLLKKFKKNWRVLLENGEERLYRPETLRMLEPTRATAPQVPIEPYSPEFKLLPREEKAAIIQAKTEAKAAERAGITDFGEKIGGARKDYAQTFAEAKTLDIRTEPFSKVWPEPDYQKLVKEGADPWVIGFVRAMRDEVPTKPRQGWKLSQYVNQVTLLRDAAENFLSGKLTKEAIQALIKQPKYAAIDDKIAGSAELYEAVGHDQSLKGIRFSHNHWSLYKGEENVWKWEVTRRAKATTFSNMPQTLAEGNTREEALERFKTAIKNKQDGGKPKIKFEIYRYRSHADGGKPGWHIGKKLGRHHADLFTFETSKQARDYLNENYDDVAARLEAYKLIGQERRTENAPRIGADHRQGSDVTPAMFQDAFGFRGVEFGNYVEQARRQSDLNRAYEALMDLAAILNIPPQALSLNRSLGLAFGARGTGGKNAAAAHYEPGKIAINLTKNNGPGSLAHEWFHAMDNYFLRQAGNAAEYATAQKRETWGSRPEVMAAFSNIIKTIDQGGLRKRSRLLDKKRSNDYWSTDIELAARSFESYVIERLKAMQASNDYLANISDISEYAESMLEAFFDGNTAEDLYPYLTDSETAPVVEAFDNLFATIQTKETDRGTALFSSPSPDQSQWDALSQQWEESGVQIDPRVNQDQVRPYKIVVPKDQRGQGIGTKVMESIVDLADKQGLTIVMSPSVDFGASSVERLKRFYSKFGFVKNAGRNKDFAISETMYRLPSPVDATTVQEYLESGGAPTSAAKTESERVSQALAPSGPDRVAGDGSAYSQGDFFAPEQPAAPSPGEQIALAGARAVARAKARTGRDAVSADLISGLQGNWEALAREVNSRGRASAILAQLTNREIPVWNVNGTILDSPSAVHAVMLPIRSPYFESLKVMVLDGNLKTVHSQILTVGSVAESSAHPADILGVLARLREVHGKKYTSIVFSHNHPSGDPTPSRADENVTRRLNEIADIAGWTVMDHIVTNGESYYSFREGGLLGGDRVAESPYAPRKKDGNRVPDIKPEERQAPWEAVKLSRLPVFDTPVKTALAAKHLRNGNPDAAHIFYVNIRMKLLAVERVELQTLLDDRKLTQALLAGRGREGAYGFVLDYPIGKTTATILSRRVTEIAAKLQMEFIDAIAIIPQGGYESGRESGVVAEDRALFGTPSPTQPDLFTAATAPDATEKLGQVKVGSMNALGAYRALTAKRDAGKTLTGKEEQQLLDAETALGQKLAFDMDALKGTAPAEGAGSATTQKPAAQGQKSTQQSMFMGPETTKDGQMSLFSSPAPGVV